MAKTINKRKLMQKTTLLEKTMGIALFVVSIYVFYLTMSRNYAEGTRIILFFITLFIMVISLLKIGILKPHTGGGTPSSSGGGFS